MNAMRKPGVGAEGSNRGAAVEIELRDGELYIRGADLTDEGMEMPYQDRASGRDKRRRKAKQLKRRRVAFNATDVLSPEVPVVPRRRRWIRRHGEWVEHSEEEEDELADR